mgnify:CR=1 FL=1
MMLLKDFVNVLIAEARLTVISLFTGVSIETVVERSERTGWMAEFVGVPDGWLCCSVVSVVASGKNDFIVCINAK